MAKYTALNKAKGILMTDNTPEAHKASLFFWPVLMVKLGVHIAEEVRYLALALPSKMHVGTKEIKQVWPVKGVSLVPRYAISEQQSGKVSSSSDLFYLFELGRPLSLYEPVTHVPLRNFLDSMKLTTLVKLEKTSKFSAIEKVYNEISQVRKCG